MNMPLSRPEWQRDCLLVAIKELVAYYQLSPSACLALQISRNYRLLITQDDRLSIKTLWQSMRKVGGMFTVVTGTSSSAQHFPFLNILTESSWPVERVNQRPSSNQKQSIFNIVLIAK